jgi:methionyl-tRNA formyltransferase
MNILVLSPYPEKLTDILETSGDRAVAYETAITATDPDPAEFGFAVSYGYRHLIRGEVLELWEDRLINLHVSMLPWNRGADPNFWTAHDGTPSGVSIHYIDAGIDTGDLIAQSEVPFTPEDTLATSYDRLHMKMIELFAETWPLVRTTSAPRTRQVGSGSYHRARDKEALMARLPHGWDSPIADVAQLARQDTY